MKHFFSFIFLISFSISAQEKVETPIQKEDHSPGASGMDKDYYQFYFDTIPDKTMAEKSKLEHNLMRVLRDEIHRKDRKVTPETLANIKPESIQYTIVKEDSIWVRGIKDIFKHIKFTDYMYIVKYDKYQLYVSFILDPGKYMQDPFQSELLFKKENIFLSNSATR